MNWKKRTRLSVTALEARETPAVSVAFASGNLFVRGDNTANILLLTATANNTLNVTNNGVGLGTYAASGNVNVAMGNSSDVVALQLGGFTLGGNVTISTGNNSASITDTVNVSNGTISGRLNVTMGNGPDVLNIGGGETGPVVLNGNVNTFCGGLGADVFNFAAGAKQAGLASIVGFNTLSFAGTSSGSLIINNSREGSVANTAVIQAGGIVSDSVIYVGGAGGDAVTHNGTINNSLTVLNGQGANSLNLGGTSITAGNVGYTGGNNGDQVGFVAGAQVFGDVNLSMGNGTNLYSLNTAFTVFGNFNVNAGNGDDNVGSLGAAGADIAGNASFNMGHGANTLSLDGGLQVGGNVAYCGGSGVDALTVNNVLFGSLRANLGAGADIFTYGAGSMVGSAAIDFGVDFDNDQYVQGIPVIGWAQTLRNLP